MVSAWRWRKRLSRHTAARFPSAALSTKALPSTFGCRNQTANNCARNRARYRLQLNSAIQTDRSLFALWCNGNTAPFGGVILGSNPSGAATQTAGFLALRTRRSHIYLPGVGLEIGNANVAEGDAAGELVCPGEDVDVGDGETVGVGDGGGGGIIFSQRWSWTVAPPISSTNF